MILIGDVAGEFDALVRLASRFPQENILLLGDMVDRGPKSKEVVEFAQINMAILGNHEHLMIDWYRSGGVYESDIWAYNGGGETIKSYGGSIPEQVIEWMERLPLFWEDEKIFASHAPWPTDWNLGELGSAINAKFNAIWNRDYPERKNKLQVFGHNSHWGLRSFSDSEGVFAVCLDASRSGVLTAIDTNTMKIYQEPFRAPSQAHVYNLGEI